mgnify:FL=1|jgi:hypothetical protein|tara:strand:+ start:111 stop:572 length:462 start_codon:yes stop_codon:yes gene_type:complete
MIDPITAIAGATAAFNTLKKGIQVGKDLQDMGGTMAKWAGAIADLDFADKQNQKPPWYKALGGGVEAQAMEIFAAKQKAASMRAELKDFISVVYGPSKWQEILEIEAKLRKQKREHEYRQMEIKQTIIEWATGILLFIISVGLLFGFVWIGTR